MESGAGSTMHKFGLLILLINICLKLIVGIGLWKLAMKNKSQVNLENNEIINESETGRRIFPGAQDNEMYLRESKRDSQE